MKNAPATVRIDSTLFEALFVRALKPSEALLAELREIGFDLNRMEPNYPIGIWHACVYAAQRHTYPERSKEDGMRALGRDFIGGYYGTILGKVVSAAMPLIGLERTLNRLERIWKASQPDLEFELQKEAPGQWRLRLRDLAGVMPDFCAGLIEGGAAPTGQPLSVEVLERSHEHCVLQLRSAAA